MPGGERGADVGVAIRSAVLRDRPRGGPEIDPGFGPHVQQSRLGIASGWAPNRSPHRPHIDPQTTGAEYTATVSALRDECMTAISQPQVEGPVGAETASKAGGRSSRRQGWSLIRGGFCGARPIGRGFSPDGGRAESRIGRGFVCGAESREPWRLPAGVPAAIRPQIVPGSTPTRPRFGPRIELRSPRHAKPTCRRAPEVVVAHILGPGVGRTSLRIGSTVKRASSALLRHSGAQRSGTAGTLVAAH